MTFSLGRGLAKQICPSWQAPQNFARVRPELKHIQSIAGPWPRFLPRHPRRMATQLTRSRMDAAARRNVAGPRQVGLTPRHGVTGSGVLDGGSTF